MSLPQPANWTPGDPAPDFELPVIQRAAAAQTVRLSALRGQLVVIDFWSCECPWSRRYDPYFAARVETWVEQGIHFLAVNSNANETDDQVLAALDEHGLLFTVLRDAGNEVADRYGAITTPHVYVVDRDGGLVYRGAVDDLTWRQKEPTVNYLDEALAALLAGNLPQRPESPPRGCSIVRQVDG